MLSFRLLTNYMYIWGQKKNDAMNLNVDFSTHPIYLDIKSKVIVCISSNIKISFAEMNIFEILTN